MSRLIPVIVVVVALAACSDPPAEPTSTLDPIQLPPVVVDEWLDTLVEGDYSATNQLVDHLSAAIILSVENGLSTEQTAAMIDAGIPDDVATSYWSSFGEGYEVFTGEPLADVTVGRHTGVSVNDVEYAAVTISSSTTGSVVVTRADPAGRHRVDLVGTLGPGFAALLRQQVAGLGADAASARVLDVYRTVVVPGMEVASQFDPGNRSLAAEIARLQAAVAQAG